MVKKICLLKFSIIVDLSVVTVFPSLSAVGSWEEVLLFSIDVTVQRLWCFHIYIGGGFVRPCLVGNNMVVGHSIEINIVI